MANDSIKKLQNQLRDATEAREEIEPLFDLESEKLAGGEDTNIACQGVPGINNGCPPDTPGINFGCPQAPAP